LCAEAVRDFLEGLRGRIHLTFEQGSLAAWLHDLVKPLVVSVIVCNPRYNRVVLFGNKSDRIDARKLAEQLRLGNLRPVYQTQHSLRPLKQLVYSYEALISDSVRTMTRIKSLYQGRGILCRGEKLYSPQLHDFWLSKIQESGLKSRLKLLFSQLDSLMPLRQEAQKKLLAESQKYPAVKILRKIPCLGPIRSAQIVAVVGSPHRFRTKRQYWPYCGLAVVTRSTSDHEIIDGRIRRKKRKAKTRGLNPDYSRILKRVYKSAALQASTDKILDPLYHSLLEKGLQPALARLTIARRLSSTSLTLWKKEERFDAQKFFSTDINDSKGVTQKKEKTFSE
jgi:transposase